MTKLININEEWVLTNLQLTPDEAFKQESINLSGSYTDRILSLGRSLMSFHSLVSLDLSRNMLQSLKGLHHLKHLRSLNLYLNDISNIKELYRLRSNKQLREIDIRLNPVTKAEPDFRLFLVYMLPQLRKLDDRGVYEQERAAALLHFSSDQAHNFSFNSPDENDMSYELKNASEYHTHPRVKMVQNAFPLTHSALDDDDVTVLDLLSKSRIDAAPPPVTSSEPVVVGNPFTEIEERIQSRLNINSNMGQVFASFLTDITNVIRCHWPNKVTVSFVDDLNEVVEKNFLDFSEKEDGISRREEEWQKEQRSLEQRVEIAEREQRDHQVKLRELEEENSNLRSVENEISPMKEAFSQFKGENKHLQEKIKIQESRIQDMNVRMIAYDKDRSNLENSIEEKRKQLEDNLASLKEIRGLAAMLRETHQALTSNNNFLLQENSQLKERHEQEINQMHFSYQQLRKSFDVWKEANKQSN
ncbi:CEP72 [Oopsacas minuta]|uniref:CEP72 n=1 Tax=Oopsacas minuta TaxID=111878 RepID=A0AAV7K6G5_9METZ|nr:CEP72 [Oopsacas minuta]